MGTLLIYTVLLGLSVSVTSASQDSILYNEATDLYRQANELLEFQEKQFNERMDKLHEKGRLYISDKKSMAGLQLVINMRNMQQLINEARYLASDAGVDLKQCFDGFIKEILFVQTPAMGMFMRCVDDSNKNIDNAIAEGRNQVREYGKTITSLNEQLQQCENSGNSCNVIETLIKSIGLIPLDVESLYMDVENNVNSIERKAVSCSFNYTNDVTKFAASKLAKSLACVDDSINNKNQ